MFEGNSGVVVGVLGGGGLSGVGGWWVGCGVRWLTWVGFCVSVAVRWRAWRDVRFRACARAEWVFGLGIIHVLNVMCIRVQFVSCRKTA